MENKKNFVEINFLDEILASVKHILPKDLKYIRLYLYEVGFEQDSLDLNYYNSEWIELEIDYDFSESEKLVYDNQYCLSDYIYNALGGWVDTDFFDSQNYTEFEEKIKHYREYFYEYKIN